MGKPLPRRPLPRREPLRERAFAKQENMFGEDDKLESDYTLKIPTPIYVPKGKKPHLIELVDMSKAKKLIKEIKSSGLSPEEKAFLITAAGRHDVFYYGRIANYYAHATPEMKRLMEKSALVIIDFEDAIKEGYVKFTKEIAQIYENEHGKTP
jgi:hypothetical protein